MAAIKTPVTLNAAGNAFTFRRQVLVDLPEAGAFLEGLLARQTIAPASAAHYVKLVSRLKRQGRLADPSLITHNVERTAANAYVRWRTEMYDARLAPVARALARHLKDKTTLRHVRVHGLVPPFAGKQIPRVTAPPPANLDSLRSMIGQHVPAAPLVLNTVMVDSSAWTLHVPEKPCAAHADPCPSCIAIELNAEELDVIAQAFERAWGHRDVYSTPQDAYLFGEPPPDGAQANGVKVEDPRARLAKAEQLLTWVWDALVVQMPVVHGFKNWSDEKWTELCALIGKPTGL